jgi:hypothetical protein
MLGRLVRRLVAARPSGAFPRALTSTAAATNPAPVLRRGDAQPTPGKRHGAGDDRRAPTATGGPGAAKGPRSPEAAKASLKAQLSNAVRTLPRADVLAALTAAKDQDTLTPDVVEAILKQLASPCGQLGRAQRLDIGWRLLAHTLQAYPVHASPVAAPAPNSVPSRSRGGAGGGGGSGRGGRAGAAVTSGGAPSRPEVREGTLVAMLHLAAACKDVDAVRACVGLLLNGSIWPSVFFVTELMRALVGLGEGQRALEVFRSMYGHNRSRVPLAFCFPAAGRAAPLPYMLQCVVVGGFFLGGGGWGTPRLPS